MTLLQPMDDETPVKVPGLPDPDFPTAEYVGGPAGTGKTYLVRERAERYNGVQLCATTGIAAVNLGEGVTTINALLGYYDTASLQDLWTQGFLSSKLMRLWQSGLRHIVLDEVSMLDAEQLTIMSLAVQEINQRLEGQGGRLGLTLTGDFCQLPPVKAPFAFESDAWGDYDQNKTMLTKFWRQTDPNFLQALQDARRGQGARAAEYFEPFFQLGQDPDYPSVTLLAKNDDVDRFNALRMSKLPWEKVSYKSVRWGKPRAEWKQIPEMLNLKVGALVMVLANQKEYDDEGAPTGDYDYVNGDLGELLDDTPTVKLRRTGKTKAVMPVRRDTLVPLEPGRRKELVAQGKGHLIVCSNISCRTCREGEGEKCKNARFEIAGQVTYVPLRLAYATTVHKSQGLTLDQVQVDFRDGFFKSPGMLYVALSRVRTPEGLRLVGRPEQFVQRCKADPKVGGWL